jgi:tetratricopeptide (TPR) repeat protein
MALLGAEIQQGIDGMPWAQLQGLYDAFVAVLDRFHATWPVAEPPLEQSDVLNLLANAALIGGDVAKARQLHQQALDLQPSAQAYLEFGQMEARAGDPTRARELLQAGLAVGTGNLADRTLAQANIHEELGLLEAAQGNQQVANEAFDEAIDDWKQLGRAGALPEAQVDAKIGVLQVRGGQREQGLQRIALAVREAGEDEFGPDEDSVVYNDTLSFLHMQGERELLTELFAQAATRQDLQVEWRVYYALWTLGASRRDGLPDDPETLAFLDAIRATDWSGVLARFYRGELTFDAALASADTLGQQTELRYYEALNRIDAGDREGARALLQQVIDTHIFNYFEWEMARHTMAGLDAASPAASTDAQPGDVSVSR